MVGLLLKKDLTLVKLSLQKVNEDAASKVSVVNEITSKNNGLTVTTTNTNPANRVADLDASPVTMMKSVIDM